MAPNRLWKHGVPAGSGRFLLVAAALVVVVGLALPGAAAAQGQQGQAGTTNGSVIVSQDVVRACVVNSGKRLLDCTFLNEEGVRGCCQVLKFNARFADDCVCGVLKVITEGRGINLDNLCGATGIQKQCQAKAEKARRDQEKKAEEERAAKEREDALSKLEPCERFFERMADKDLSKLDPADARACIQATMKTCPASCKN